MILDQEIFAPVKVTFRRTFAGTYEVKPLELKEEVLRRIVKAGVTTLLGDSILLNKTPEELIKEWTR
jgi:hypothetical protein